jgi:hypothetical protein
MTRSEAIAISGAGTAPITPNGAPSDHASGAFVQDIRQTTGDNPMTEDTSGSPKADHRLVHVDDGDMHVVEDGMLGAPALLLIHGSAASLVCWDLVVPALAGTYRVIRVDLLGCGKSTTPPVGVDTTFLLRRAGSVPCSTRSA